MKKPMKTMTTEETTAATAEHVEVWMAVVLRLPRLMVAHGGVFVLYHE